MKFIHITKALILLLTTAGLPAAENAAENSSKPRVIVMTDGEIDDHSSMIRFLLYTCDVELEAIIETNSIFQRKGHSDKDWYDKQLDAYQEIYPNLIKHNPGYPTPEEIRALSFVGDEDEAHLKDLWWRNLFEKMIPGAPITHFPDKWVDTPGSEKIIEVLLKDNPAPVYIQAWGGANTAARAFYKLKTEYPESYAAAISKVIMYNIWYQDGAGTYIEHHHPLVKMLYSASFKGSWDYNSLPETKNFVSKYVKHSHGPLGALYPQDYISEGDTPAFLYNMAPGLRNDESPTYGGWGGRFSKFAGAPNTYMDAIEGGDKWLSLRRWIDDANTDFHARLEWCVNSYDDANHHPIISPDIPLSMIAAPGETVSLDALVATDPDGDEVFYSWWHYHFAGYAPYREEIPIENSDRNQATITIPTDAAGKDLHLILTVEDNGLPSLKSYHRLVISVQDQ
jgi:hypothetical protein